MSTHAPHDGADALDRERAINTHQVSELLGLAAVTLAQLRQRGSGPRFFRVGRQVRYRLGDVLSYRDARTVARRDAEVLR
jgi:predicted DNA-binding transcriptional regulator AlpA